MTLHCLTRALPVPTCCPIYPAYCLATYHFELNDPHLVSLSLEATLWNLCKFEDLNIVTLQLCNIMVELMCFFLSIFLCSLTCNLQFHVVVEMTATKVFSFNCEKISTYYDIFLTNLVEIGKLINVLPNLAKKVSVFL